MKKSEIKKTKICVICGGVSPEHTISIASAASVVGNIDRDKYDVSVIGVGRDNGEWRYYGDDKFYKDDGNIDSYKLLDNGWYPVFIKPGKRPCFYYQSKKELALDVDVLFPVIHGDNGEDGKLQGLIEGLGYPLVGCGTLASAAGMDKDISKLIAIHEGVNVVPWIFYSMMEQVDIENVIKKLGLPVFVKPVSSGSSCGITKVKDSKELLPAIKEAFNFSKAVIVEKAVDAREIEVSVLGSWNKNILVSVPGEIIPKREFYNYEAKYVDKNGADLVVPAKLDQDQINKIKKYAENIFRSLRCSGMSRVDFFVSKKDGEVFFNEINTIPGFTTISMYPKLLSASGIPYTKLLDELISLALEDLNAQE